MNRLLKYVLVTSMAALADKGDPPKMVFKYDYFNAPKYSTDGVTFKKIRSEFSFKSFSPEFKQAYTLEYGVEPIKASETQYLWANIFAIPAGALLGFGFAQFVVRDPQPRLGAILCLSSIPFLGTMTWFNISSFRSLKNGMASK